jgi:glycosyltransferase involved in cell wall biosynthesis
MNYDFTEPDQDTRFITYAEKVSLQHADLVITHSTLNQENLMQQAGQVTYSTAAFKVPARPFQPALPGESIYPVLVVGRLQSCKGIGVMADALRKARKAGSPLQVTWIGADTYSAPGGFTWTEYLRRNYPDIWQKDLNWLGTLSHEETLNRMRRSQMVVVPSVWETFSFVALEAVVLNKPVIITETAGAAAYFVNGESALVIPSKDPDGLIEAIAHLAADESLRDQLTLQAGVMLEKRFDPGKIVKERMEAYASAVSIRHSKGAKVPDYKALFEVINEFPPPILYPVKKIFRKLAMKFFPGLFLK